MGVNNYKPQSTEPVPDIRSTKCRLRLLVHTSGYTYGTNGSYQSREKSVTYYFYVEFSITNALTMMLGLDIDVVARDRHALESCLIFDGPKSRWIEYISQDSSFLQAIILLAQSHASLARGSYHSSRADQAQLSQTMQLLRRKITGEDTEVMHSETTLFTMIVLATHALIASEHMSARLHLEAIRKVVDINGGLSGIMQTKLRLEICRYSALLYR